MTDPTPLAEAPSNKRFWVNAWAVLIALLPLPIVFVGGLAVGGGTLGFVFSLLAAPPLVYGALKVVKKTGAHGASHVLYLVTSVLVLIIFPILGLAVDGAADACKPSCHQTFRPLAMPEVFTLVPLHTAAAFAFFLSVRRPHALAPRVEAAIVAVLAAGIVLHVALGVQFLLAVPYAMYIIPLPIVTPYLTVPLLAHHLVGRLRARGHEALVLEAERAEERQTGYREAPVVPLPVTRSPMHLGILLRGLVGAPLVLGIHAVVMGVVLRSPSGGVDAFLNTCGYMLSRLPVPPQADCHYLCTIAAQGSPRLVRPYRWGMRRGQPILVNRQLALANAFEDLLHERWPRFGRLARRTYDALAFPLSRALSRRWIANALYVLMKPAEVVFFIALLFLDPGDPESRIDGMYR